MPRPDCQSLQGEPPRWQSAPMPGATAPLDIVRLASEGAAFVILGRFPAGFERPAIGGYEVAEEFVLLDGALELEGAVVRDATLCFIPAHHVRGPMRSPEGCTVLAWFSGPAIFRAAEELPVRPASGMCSVYLRRREVGEVLRTTEAQWTVVERPPQGGWPTPVDVVDLALTSWAHVSPGKPAALPSGPLLVRNPQLDGSR